MKKNLNDDVEDTSVDEFLTFYTIYQDFKLFKFTPMDTYFDKKHLYTVILRYIAYEENKIDRNDFTRLENF